jgi:hypothetical protein
LRRRRLDELDVDVDLLRTELAVARAATSAELRRMRVRLVWLAIADGLLLVAFVWLHLVRP